MAGAPRSFEILHFRTLVLGIVKPDRRARKGEGYAVKLCNLLEGEDNVSGNRLSFSTPRRALLASL